MTPVQRNIGYACRRYGSEAALAVRLRRTQPTVSAWLRGKRAPPQACMEALAVLLGVHPADVLYGDVETVLATRGTV